MSSYICEDLMVNIFERLPPKSVLRFRTLSKYWCSRLASRDFIRMHNLRSFDNNCSQKVLFRHRFRIRDGDSKDMFTLHSGDQFPLDQQDITGVELPFDIRDAQIVGSCNGLLCFNNNGSISLWNFSIRRKLNVPLHPSIKDSIVVPKVVFGFGFDPISDDYKIVGISYPGYGKISYDNNAFAYSMKSDSWSVIASPTIPFRLMYQNACYLKGKLHWMVEGEDSFIMTLSLTTHVFDTIKYPKSISAKFNKALTIINGSLGVIFPVHVHTCIWVMNEYDNIPSWSEVFKLKTGSPKFRNILQPITNGVLFIHDNDKCKVYNPEAELFTKFWEHKIRFGYCLVDIITYVESLELLDRGIDCGKTTSLPKRRILKEITLHSARYINNNTPHWAR